VELADLQQEDAREGLSGKHRVSLSLGCKSLQSYLILQNFKVWRVLLVLCSIRKRAYLFSSK
jgi:hypothetical protein